MKNSVSPLLASALALTVACPATCEARGSVPTEPAAISVPTEWQYADSPGTQAQTSPDNWWNVFGDRQLDDLIARMHAGNTTIPKAAARLAAAEAEARLGDAALAPQVGIDASATHASGPLINAAGGSGSLYSARVSTVWEADVFGRLTSQRSAGRLEAKAAEALLRDTRLLMETRTAIVYFRCLQLHAEARLAADEEALLDEAERIAGQRRQLGLISQPEFNAAQRQVSEAHEAKERAQVESDNALRLLAYLLGDPATIALQDAPLGEAPLVPAGLPDDVLARRPDLAAAISRVQAADKRLTAVRRSWLPGVVLTASGGGASSSLGQILSSASRDFGLGLLLSLPVFDGGRHKAMVAGSKAAAALAAAEYRDRLLLALREVNDSLGELHEARQRTALAKDRLALATMDGMSASAAQANGTTSRNAVIASKLGELRALRDLVQSRAEALFASVRLIEALGGGWVGGAQDHASDSPSVGPPAS